MQEVQKPEDKSRGRAKTIAMMLKYGEKTETSTINEEELEDVLQVSALSVEVIEARGVKAADLTGKSDPYCKVIYFFS